MTARARIAREPKHLIAAAELLPADKHTYRPTPAQMTFGDLIAHIVQARDASLRHPGRPSSVER